MKIEKRKNTYGQDSVLIAHNDMAVFINKQEANKFDLRVTVKHGEIWDTVSSMDLTAEELKSWIKLLGMM